MRRWLFLAAATFALALGLLASSTMSTQAQEPTRTPRPAVTPRATPLPTRPSDPIIPIRPADLTAGGQTIAGPGTMKTECGTVNPIFANRIRENKALDVSVTLVNLGGCDLYLAVVSPTDTSLEPTLLGPITAGNAQAVALSIPYQSQVVVACRGENTSRCAFEWRVDQIN